MRAPLSVIRPSPVPTRRRWRGRLVAPLLTLLLMGGCSPRLDWREVQLQGAEARVMFPCKPDQGERAMPGPAAGARMGLAQCETAGLRFALSWAEVEDPARIVAALEEMPRALAGKLQARTEQVQPLTLAGATPNPQSRQMWLHGLLGPGQAAQVPVAVFTRGQRVYQLMILGPGVKPADWDTFLGSVRLGV